MLVEGLRHAFRRAALAHRARQGADHGPRAVRLDRLEFAGVLTPERFVAFTDGLAARHSDVAEQPVIEACQRLALTRPPDPGRDKAQEPVAAAGGRFSSG